MQNVDCTILEILDPLTRLIPEKPIPAELCPTVFRSSRCPCCHAMLSLFSSFCDRCGQALDWSSYSNHEIFLVLPVPVDQIAEVERYVSAAGEIPACVDLPALGRALDFALRNVEVPGNE